MLRFMRKKLKKKLIRWRVSLIGKTLARYIDHTLAPDAEIADEQVAEAHDIGSPLCERIRWSLGFRAQTGRDLIAAFKPRKYN
jgi:hypothetical protein